MSNKPNVILLLGNRQDMHIQAVAKHIKLSGHEYRIFDRYSDDSISVNFNDDIEIRFCCEEGHFSGSEIAVAWWRLKPMKIWSPENTDVAIASEFSSREWKSLLFSIPMLLHNTHWVNKFPQHIISAYKPYQLKTAMQVGLNIPQTLFSNRPVDIINMLKSNDRTIYKQFSNFMFPGNDFIFTNEVMLNDLDNAHENLSMCPGIFQPLIEKHAEWRITLVGKKLFSIFIDSQQKPETSIDWRRSQSEDMYIVKHIDSDTAEKIIKFAECIGIEYAAFDFIQTVNGDMIFLECNPGGQWLWLEEMTGVEISKSFSKHLISYVS